MNLTVIDNIIWLGPSERILTLDFHPFFPLLAIGGSQSPQALDEDEESQDYKEELGYIKIFEYDPNQQKKETMFKFIRGLQGHSKCVNGLKFSPNGQYMASVSDDTKVKIWEMKWVTNFGGSKTYKWDVISTLDGHSGEVLDVQWSVDGKYLVTCGFDKRSIVWEVEKNKYISVLDGHKGFVKGVSFDPKMKFIISQGDDRQAKIFKNVKTSKKSNKTLNFMIKNNINRQEYKKKDDMQSQSDDDQEISNVSIQNSQTFPLFIQENQLSTFVKRPDWSPDGQLFILVATQYSDNENQKPYPCVLIFKRAQINKPSQIVPTNGFPAIVVRFLKKIFKLKPNQKKILDQDYQMIYAIATTETVEIHSTQQIEPIAVMGNMHYSLLNDLSWQGSEILGICSADGYCSFCKFEKGFFGEEMTLEEIKALDEELLPAFSQNNYYSEAQYQELINNSIENLQKKKPTMHLNKLQFAPNYQIQVQTDNQGVKKKKIVPMMIKKPQNQEQQQQQQQPTLVQQDQNQNNIQLQQQYQDNNKNQNQNQNQMQNQNLNSQIQQQQNNLHSETDNQYNPDNLNLNEIFKIQKSQYLDENSQPPQEREYCEVYYLIFTIYSQNYYFEKVLLKTIFQQNKLIRPKSNSHQNSQEVNINKEINFFYKIFHKYISAKGIILSGVKYSCENQSIFAKTDKKMLQLLIFNLFQVICIIQGAEYKISVQTVKDNNIENVQIVISTYDKQVIKNLSSQSSTNSVQNQQIINIKQYLLICGSILSEIGPNGEVNLHYQESSQQPFQMKLNLYQDIKVINLCENPKKEDLNSNIGIIEQFIHAGRENSQREINLQQQNQKFNQNKLNFNQKYPPIQGQGQMNRSPQHQKKNLLVSNFIGNLNQSFMPNMLDYKQDENKLKKLKKITFQGENQQASILKSTDDFDIKLRQSTQQNLFINKKNPENQLLKSPKNQLATSIYDKNINFDSNNSLKKVRENQINHNPQKNNNTFNSNSKINVNLNVNQKQSNFDINEESQEEFSPQKQDHLLQNYNYNNNYNNNSFNYNMNNNNNYNNNNTYNNYPPLSMDQSQSQQLISNTNTNIQLAKFNSKNSQGHINLNIQNLSHNFNNQSSNIQTNNNSNIFDFSYNNSSNQSPQIRDKIPDSCNLAVERYLKSRNPQHLDDPYNSRFKQLKELQLLENMKKWDQNLLKKNKTDMIIDLTQSECFPTQKNQKSYLNFVRNNVYTKTNHLDKNQYTQQGDFLDQAIRNYKPSQQEFSLAERDFLARYQRYLVQSVAGIDKLNIYDSMYEQKKEARKDLAYTKVREKLIQNDIESRKKYNLLPMHASLMLNPNVHSTEEDNYKKLQLEKEYERQKKKEKEIFRIDQQKIIQTKSEQQQLLADQKGWFKLYLEGIQNVIPLNESIVKFKFKIQQNLQSPIYQIETPFYDIMNTEKNQTAFYWKNPPIFHMYKISHPQNNYLLIAEMYNGQDKLIAWSAHQIFNTINELERGIYKLPFYPIKFNLEQLLKCQIDQQQPFSLQIKIQNKQFKYENKEVKIQPLHLKIQQNLQNYRQENFNTKYHLTQADKTQREKLKLFTAQEQDKFKIEQLVKKINAVQIHPQQENQQKIFTDISYKNQNLDNSIVIKKNDINYDRNLYNTQHQQQDSQNYLQDYAPLFQNSPQNEFVPKNNASNNSRNLKQPKKVQFQSDEQNNLKIQEPQKIQNQQNFSHSQIYQPQPLKSYIQQNQQNHSNNYNKFSQLNQFDPEQQQKFKVYQRSERNLPTQQVEKPFNFQSKYQSREAKLQALEKLQRELKEEEDEEKQIIEEIEERQTLEQLKQLERENLLNYQQYLQLKSIYEERDKKKQIQELNEKTKKFGRIQVENLNPYNQEPYNFQNSQFIDLN
ncbi:WD40-repeat-containing domain [Pseudocohnilembus persalinus]|uniref:WD40-repeat-containing domain n=1 Tax=Pseudocohnilembus persalinus TaxID=266149 RepID=A0A0V0QST5_PSEPJ|nr:WD40-repeat-containing domain [Pseudocohnilembus persalinus]|eukprot:KRX05359.1 WD40-repeat-containing domain [Pseudocohnilembus persalinus]